MPTAHFAAFAIAVFMFAAAPSHAQLVREIPPEDAATNVYRSLETEFDFVEFAIKQEAAKITSASALRSKLVKNDVCGKDRDGTADASVDGMCALLIHVYEQPSGLWATTHGPVFDLEAPSIAHHAQSPAESARIIGPRQMPAMVRFRDILPTPGERAAIIDGKPIDGVYLFSLVVGKRENEQRAESAQIPAEFFDHERYR